MPDRGELLAYDRSQPVRRARSGAYAWHPVQLSETHALRAITAGELALTTPDGRVLRFRYARHVEHPDGNWTWIGRIPGDAPGTEAIITFGERAVFGTIPNGEHEPLRLTTIAGRPWMIETDRAAEARLRARIETPGSRDFLPAPKRMQGGGRTFSAQAEAGSTVPGKAVSSAAGTTVDVLIGYTSGFATRLGGQSQAVTRLAHLVAVANQAYQNSMIYAELRLVATAQVNYSDTVSNDKALYDLTGVDCTEDSSGSLSCRYVGVSAALQTLHTARDLRGADMVTLVRNFNDPEHGSCGIAWLNGAGQSSITSSDEAFAMSVVSDSNGNMFPDNGYICRDETYVHELGHNMGSAHDRGTADGDDNVLQADEYGRYPYSFGYKTGSAAGNFYTVMAYGDSGQTRYRVFSNPGISSCGGHACGVPDQADNARSLNQTISITATFRDTVVIDPIHGVFADFNADGVSDLLWRHAGTGSGSIWLSANKATVLGVSRVSDLAWRMVGIGQFNGDGAADILWRNMTTGANTIWLSGDASQVQGMSPVTSQSWQIVGIGDFDSDGVDDVLWRNFATGANVIWRSANKAVTIPMKTITNMDWQIVGVGDFGGDGSSDVLWRNRVSGANAVWLSGDYAGRYNLTTISNLSWQVAGVADFDADGRDDILWRNATSGANAIWNGGDYAARRSISSVTDLDWRIEATGDYDGDGRADIMWRHAKTGANMIWSAANKASQITLPAVTDAKWQVQP